MRFITAMQADQLIARIDESLHLAFVHDRQLCMKLSDLLLALFPEWFQEAAAATDSTHHLPKTAGKVLAMAARVRAGCSPWHADDAQPVGRRALVGTIEEEAHETHAGVVLDNQDMVSEWIVILPDQRTVTVKAPTKSEARSLAKRVLGFAAKARLPAGTLVRPVHFSDVLVASSQEPEPGDLQVTSRLPDAS